MMKKLKMFVLGIGLLAALVPFGSRAWLIERPPYFGPGDIVAFSAWYGVRGYSAAKAAAGTTKMVRVRQAGSGELCDILVSLTGGVGLTTNCTGSGAGKTTNVFCNTPAGGCRIQTWYDQTGNLACGGSACDLTQNTATRQYQMGNATGVANTNIQTVGAAEDETSASNFTPTTAVLSVSLVADRTSGFTGNGKYISGFGSNNGLECNTVANQMKLVGGSSGSIILAVTDNAWHAVNAVINGSSSVAMVNGVDTTGTAVASTAGAAPNSTIPTFTTCAFSMREAGFINNHAFTTIERADLNAAQRAYWAF